MMPDTMWTNKLILLCILLLSLTVTESKAALTREEIDHLRSELHKNINNIDLGSSYAYILNFFIEPDVSASTYDVNDDANTRLDIYKLPMQKNFSLNTDGWEIALRGIISYATLDTNQKSIENGAIDSKWKAYSGSIGTGLLVPVINDLTVITAVDLGLSHMDNSSKYHGLLANTLGQIFDGILYNWDTDAWIGSLVFGLNYNHLFTKEYTLDLKGQYTYSHVSSFNGSNGFPSFNGNAQTLALAADFTHPLGFSIGQYPFFGVAHLGNTSFLGKNRDTLGFDSFIELGYFLKVDITHLNLFIQTIHFGYQWSIGDNVKGHTFLFGLNLATF